LLLETGPSGRRRPINASIKVNVAPMLLRSRHTATIAAILVTAGSLCGCGTINEKLASGVSDTLPAWAGGLPADAPPRPGTMKYDEYMKERERKRLLPAAERGEESNAASASKAVIQ
jgi:hypothetical protein